MEELNIHIAWIAHVPYHLWCHYTDLMAPVAQLFEEPLGFTGEGYQEQLLEAGAHSPHRGPHATQNLAVLSGKQQVR